MVFQMNQSSYSNLFSLSCQMSVITPTVINVCAEQWVWERRGCKMDLGYRAITTRFVPWTKKNRIILFRFNNFTKEIRSTFRWMCLYLLPFCWLDLSMCIEKAINRHFQSKIFTWKFKQFMQLFSCLRQVLKLIFETNLIVNSSNWNRYIKVYKLNL